MLICHCNEPMLNFWENIKTTAEKHCMQLQEEFFFLIDCGINSITPGKNYNLIYI